jgi:hypothetical protein
MTLYDSDPKWYFKNRIVPRLIIGLIIVVIYYIIYILF